MTEKTISLKRPLVLPKVNYGPFCVKILLDFMEYHKIEEDLPVPTSSSSNEEALGRIFDIILHSMSNEKRMEIMKELDEYKMGIPAALR